MRDEHVEDVPADRLHLAFRLPVDDTPEFFAAVAGDGRPRRLATSRLYQRLVRREQIANGVQAHAMGFVDGVSLGFIGIDVAEGASADEVEAHTCEELRRFAEEGPTDVEMESALAQTERVVALRPGQPGGARRRHLPPGDAAGRRGLGQHVPRPARAR